MTGKHKSLKNKDSTTSGNSIAAQLDPSKFLHFDLPQPKLKLKPVSWSKIPTAKIASINEQRQKSSHLTENVWTPLKSANFVVKDQRQLQENAATVDDVANCAFKLDFEALDLLFCHASPNSGRRSSTTAVVGTSNLVECPNRRKRETATISLLSSRRSLNINIFLTAFKENVDELLDFIACGQSSKIGVDKLDSLLKLLPEPEEVEILNSHWNDMPKLDQAEQFILKLISLDNYKLRIESMLLTEDFDSAVSRTKSSLHILIKAAEGILNSRRLREILHLILMIGNYLNSGTDACGAAGFKLSSLMRIVELRANNGNVTLMHHLISIMEKNNPTLMEFGHDLINIEDAASKDTLEIINDYNKHMKSKVESISQQIDMITGKFKSQMTIFLSYARRELTSIEQELIDVETWRQKLAEYFCDDAATFKLNECFKLFRDFKARFLKALYDVKGRNDARRRTFEQQRNKFDALSVEAPEIPPYASPMISRRMPNKLDQLLESNLNGDFPSCNIFGQMLTNRSKDEPMKILACGDRRRRSSSTAFNRNDSRERDLLTADRKLSPTDKSFAGPSGAGSSLNSPMFLVQNLDEFDQEPCGSKDVAIKFIGRRPFGSFNRKSRYATKNEAQWLREEKEYEALLRNPAPASSCSAQTSKLTSDSQENDAVVIEIPNPSEEFEVQTNDSCSNPPGGKASDIFNKSGDASPFSSPQRRKKFDSNKSNIFVGDATDSNGNVQKTRSNSPLLNVDTKQRLFGAADCEKSPKRVSDTYRSNVFTSSPTENGCSPKSNDHSTNDKPKDLMNGDGLIDNKN